MENDTDTLTPSQVTAKLAVDGWAIHSEVIDAGRYDKPSKHNVTLARKGASYSTLYTMGAAHRVWISEPSFVTCGWQGPFTAADRKALGKPKVGNRVSVMTMYGVSLMHEQALLKCTGPATPEMADVLYSLVSDTSCVRYGQTFADFAAGMGLDEDSRTAERTYNGCRDEWSALLRLGADLDELDKLFQDY